MKPLIARHEVAPVHQQIRLEHGNNDYIGSMPLKLLLQIAEYLDPADIVRCQRVSKRWHKIFSFEPVIRYHLDKALVFLGLGSKDAAVDDAMTYFRWRHGLQYGQPVKKITLPRLKAAKGFDVYSSESRRLCHGKTISTTAEMLDLETGERSILTDPVDESRAELSY